jgi:hypothetical protein
MRVCADEEVDETRRTAKPAKAIPCERNMVHSTEDQELMGRARSKVERPRLIKLRGMKNNVPTISEKMFGSPPQEN